MEENPSPACACGAPNRGDLEDGTLARMWSPAPARATTYQSPWAADASPVLWCSATVPDVGFLFRQCRTPERGIGDAAFAAAAVRLGVQEAAIRAVAEVETKQSAFDASGRPTILYERHYFRRLTGGRFDTSHPDLSGPPYGRGGYGLMSAQYGRLQAAHALDPWAALQSVSWGRFQIMGSHYATLGYASPQHMALALAQSEVAHLEGFVAFVMASPRCLRGLRSLDWATFASCYNGANYAEYDYDTQMRQAYERLTRAAPAADPAASAARALVPRRLP